MDEYNGNGHRATLPPMKLGTGPEWEIPVELAAAFIQLAWRADRTKAGKWMAEAIGGPQ